MKPLELNLIKHLFVFILIWYFTSSCKNKPETLENNLDVASEKLEPGDIILKCGYGFISNSIIKILQEPISISHCGIVCIQHDSIFVTHSIAAEISDKDGVQTKLLNEFLLDTKPESLFILRHKSSFTKRQQIQKRALLYLQEKTPFDYAMDITEKSSIYCSELVFHVLNDCQLKHDIKIENIQDRPIIMFNSLINDTNNFKLIKIRN